MAYDFVSKNGALIPAGDAVLPVSNIEFAYGFGVYENVRVVRGNALFLSEHIERLLRSARVIDLKHTLDEATLAKWTLALTEACKADALNLKILMIGAREPKDVQLFILPLAPLFPDKKLYVKGAIAVSTEYERSFPDAKTLNMLGSYIAYRKAKENNAYDALLVNRNGCVTEGTRTNFFGIKGKTITGAPMKEILEGVTMRHVLKVAKENGFEVTEADIPLSSLKNFDGVFLTSTSSKIMPLSQVDGQAMQIPESLKTLMKHYEDFLEKEYAK